MDIWSRDLIVCFILYQHTTFEPNPRILGKVITIFPKSEMAAAAILFLQ